MKNPVSDYLNSLDAVTYFFVNSGVFIAVTAGIFFILGLWFGRYIWGHSKPRLNDAERVIGAFKMEVAALKRRIAEQSARPLAQFQYASPMPLMSQFTARGTGPAYPPSRMFYIWGEEDWEGPAIQPEPAPASRAFSLWTAPDYIQPFACLIQPGRGFSLWTEQGWMPPTTRLPTPRSGRSFCLWTEESFLPPQRILFEGSRAFTLWTDAAWAPMVALPLRQPPSQAGSLWTDGSFEPVQRILFSPSQAFSVWTEDGWSRPITPEILPPGRPTTLWIDYPLELPEEAEPIQNAFQEDDFPSASSRTPTSVDASAMAARPSAFARVFGVARSALKLNRGNTPAVPQAAPPLPAQPKDKVLTPPPPAKLWAVPASRAFSIWTEPGWEAPSVPVAPVVAKALPSPLAETHPAFPPSRAFTLWTQRGWHPSPPSASKVVPAVAEVAVPSVRKPTVRVDGMPVYPSPPSRAFSIWTESVGTPKPHVRMPKPVPAIPLEEPLPLPIISPRTDGGQLLGKPRALPPQAHSVTPWSPASTTAVAAGISPFPMLPDESGEEDAAVPAYLFKSDVSNGQARHDSALGVVYVTKPEDSDDLTALRGVPGDLEEKLNALGVYRFKQIALWTEPQAREFSHRLSLKDRLFREKWTEQARELHFVRHGERL